MILTKFTSQRDNVINNDIYETYLSNQKKNVEVCGITLNILIKWIWYRYRDFLQYPQILSTGRFKITLELIRIGEGRLLISPKLIKFANKYFEKCQFSLI